MTQEFNMKINKLFLLLGIAITSLAMTLASCSRDDEITSISFSRLFSALGLEARVQNQINVRLTWKAVSGADSYIVNVYESVNQEGEAEDAADNTQFVKVPEGAEPVRHYEDIKNTEIIIENLIGQTRYIFEVIAADENGGKSVGVCTEAKTGSEQTFLNVDDAEIEANSVVLHWVASDATGCIIKVQADGEEGYTAQHEITAAEAAEKTAVIEGLTGETNYTAYMKTVAGKTRGTITFKTAIDLGDAIPVYPEDNLNKVIAAAEDGATLALFPGTYECTSEEGAQVKIKIEKSISIKAVRPGDRPIIKGCLQLYQGASLSLQQVVLDGTGSDGSQAIDVKEAATYKNIIIDDCEICNYKKGAIYVNTKSTIENLTINNSLVHDVLCDGGDLFDCRAGAIYNWTITNNTVYNSAAGRDFVRFDDKSGDFPGVEPKVVVDHNTLYNVGNGGAAYRLLHVRFKGNSVTFTNNLVSGFSNTRGLSNNVNPPTNITSISGNYYHNTVNLLSASPTADAKIIMYDEKGVEVKDNPFKDAGNGDFTIVNEDINYKGVGAPRWIVAQ